MLLRLIDDDEIERRGSESTRFRGKRFHIRPAREGHPLGARGSAQMSSRGERTVRELPEALDHALGRHMAGLGAVRGPIVGLLETPAESEVESPRGLTALSGDGHDHDRVTVATGRGPFPDDVGGIALPGEPLSAG